MQRRHKIRKPRTNAAHYIQSDTLDPSQNRALGDSFLRGFIQHADVDDLCASVPTKAQSDALVTFAKTHGFTHEVKTRLITNSGLAGNQTVLHLPTPDWTTHAWRRRHVGGTAYSISAVVDTVASKAAMQNLFDLRTAPVEEWDAVICTSNAQKAAVDYQFAEADRFLKQRFGRAPKRPQMPLIPRGLTSTDYAHNDAARKSWRERLQIAPDALIVISVSRLNSFGEFDPLPLFLALEQAAVKTKQRVHYLAVGRYSDAVTQRVFENGAAQLAPSIQYHHVDPSTEPIADGLWSAADIYAHPVDSIQESFGLSPIKAMAAGLPVVVSDWDGVKDTVSRETGMRIRTLGPKPGSMRREALNYALGQDTYAQYMSQHGFQTAIDVRRLAGAFCDLFTSADLRQKMGAAGIRRARTLYDWSRIIPMYQECWAELDAIRAKALGDKQHMSARGTPTSPDPSRVFRRYPSEAADFKDRKFKVNTSKDAKQAVSDMMTLREVPSLGRMTVSSAQVVRVLETLQKHGFLTHTLLCTRLNDMPHHSVTRCLLWLLKYDFIAIQLD